MMTKVLDLFSSAGRCWSCPLGYWTWLFQNGRVWYRAFFWSNVWFSSNRKSFSIGTHPFFLSLSVCSVDANDADVSLSWLSDVSWNVQSIHHVRSDQSRYSTEIYFISWTTSEEGSLSQHLLSFPSKSFSSSVRPFFVIVITYFVKLFGISLNMITSKLDHVISSLM